MATVRRYAALASVIGLVLVIDAVTLDRHGSHRSKPLAAPRPTPVVTIPPADTAGVPAPGDPDTTGQVQAPAPGLYRYRSTVSGGPASTSEFAAQVTVRPSPLGTVTDRILTTTGVDQTVAFTPGSELELAFSQAGTSVANEITCAENPPRVLLRLPLRVGGAWTSPAACTNLLGDVLNETRTATVTGTGQDQVGPALVPVWHLDVTTTIRTAPAGGGPVSTTTNTASVDISARLGVVVREVTRDPFAAGSVRTDTLLAVTGQ